MRIGAKVTVFNAKLREAREKAGLTQAELADAVGTNPYKISQIELLCHPYGDMDDLRNLFFAISDVLDCDFSELFPADYLFAIQEKLLGHKSTRLFFVDADITSLPPSKDIFAGLLPEEVVEREALINGVRSAIDALPENEKDVVTAYYGIDSEPKTLEDIGRRRGISRERVRQVLAHAMRRMRNPATSGRLQQLL